MWQMFPNLVARNRAASWTLSWSWRPEYRISFTGLKYRHHQAISFWRLRQNPILCLSRHLDPPAFLLCPCLPTSQSTTPPQSLHHTFSSGVKYSLRSRHLWLYLSFKDLWSSHILQFSWMTVTGPSDMIIFESRCSGSYIVFRSSDYLIALCKLNNSASDAVTLESSALWKHLFWAQQGQAIISTWGGLTGVSTLPSTGCLGFSDLYLGHQSGKNWNVGRKIIRKNSIWKTNSHSAH